MSSTGLIQAVLLGVVLVVLVQMDGGVRHEIASFQLPSIPKAPAQTASSASRGSIAGVGMAGAAMSHLNAATTNSMNRSMATLDKRQ